MIRGQWPVRAFALVLGVLVSVCAYAQQPAAPLSGTEGSSAEQPARPALEAQAIGLLQAMGNHLAAARSMSFTAVVSYESPSSSGLPLVYTTRSEVLLQRPDKLRVITPGDGPALEFYYDGKTVTAYSPGENFVSIAAAPASLDAALEAVYHLASTYFPFTDMIVADPYKDIADGLTHAFYIGQSSVVGGTTTDIVAYESDGTFVQLWIGADDKLPRMARAVYLNDPAQLRHQVEFSNWQLDIDAPADAFAATQATAAMRIPFARPDAELIAADVSTPAQGASSKPGTEVQQQ